MVSAGGTAEPGTEGIVTPGAIHGDTTTPMSGTYTHTLSLGSCAKPGLPFMSPTFFIRYGITLEQVTQVGAYAPASVPCSASNPAPAVSSPSGSGAEFFCPGNYASTASWGTDNTAVFRRALADANAYASVANPRPIYVPAGNYLLHALNTAGAGGSPGMCYQNGVSNNTTCTAMCSPMGGCTNACSSGSTCQANIAAGYGAWLGDEHNHSNLFVIPESNAGTYDVLAWANAYANQSQLTLGNTQTFSDLSNNPNMAGSTVRNLTIIGDRASPIDQNAMSFYGKTGAAFVDNVVVSYMKGHAIGTGYGVVGTPTQNADIIESRVLNSNFDHDGDATASPAVPVLDLGSQYGEGSNNLDLTNIGITSPYGPGVWLHQTAMTAGASREIRLLNVRIDGTNQSLLAPVLLPPFDLLLFNDPAPNSLNGVSAIACHNVQLVNPVTGAAALHVAGRMPADATAIDCEGGITSEVSSLTGGFVDYGRGIQLDACQQCKFVIAANTTQDFNLLVGSLTAGPPPGCAGAGGTQPVLGGAGLVYDGDGAESALSTCLDPLSLNLIAFPDRQLLANGSLANTTPASPIEQVTSTVAGPGTTLTFTGTAPAVMISLTAPLWTIARGASGGSPHAAFTDTWDTGANVWGAIGNVATAGQLYRMRYCNNTAYTSTLGSNTGISGLPLTVSAGSCINLVLELTGTSNVTIVGG